MSEESRARIKFLDYPLATFEKAIMVSAKEEPDAPIPPAIDGLLKIHRHILENLPVFSLKDDSVVEIHGKPRGVLTAVELIASHLRKLLVDSSIVGVFEMQMQMPNVRANQNMLTPQTWGHLHVFQMNADGGAHVGSNPQYMYPQSQFDNYALPGLCSFDNHYHQGLPVYGRHASMGGHSSNVQAIKSVATKKFLIC
ncbi:hypothetical protein CRYUN_Cryun01aG0164100 [Craigia yunnanensis]